MNSVLRECFRRLHQNRENSEGFVFRCWKGVKKGQPVQSIRTAFTTGCRYAKLRGVSPHTLRHTFASRLATAGVDIRTIQELGGWKEIKMVERYAHLLPAGQEAAIRDFLGWHRSDTAQAVSHASL